MSENEIIEGNRLIGDFMGYNIGHDSIAAIGRKRIDFSTTQYSNSPCYHESWDWLMPAINKIGEKAEFEIGNETFYIFLLDEHGERERDICEVGKSLLESAWLTVIEYIRLQNKKND